MRSSEVYYRRLVCLFLFIGQALSVGARVVGQWLLISQWNLFHYIIALYLIVLVGGFAWKLGW